MLHSDYQGLRDTRYGKGHSKNDYPLMMYMPIRDTGKFLTAEVQERLKEQNTEWEKLFPDESAWRVQKDSPDGNRLCVNFRLFDEEQARNNHLQTLNELAHRGGKAPMELYCLMKKITQGQYKNDKTNADFLNEFYDEMNALLAKRKAELKDNLIDQGSNQTSKKDTVLFTATTNLLENRAGGSWDEYNRPIMLYMPIKDTEKLASPSIQEKLKAQNAEWQKLFPGESAWYIPTDGEDKGRLCLNMRMLNREQAHINYQQTLNKIATTNGKSPDEIYCLINRIKQGEQTPGKSNYDYLNEIYDNVNELIEKRKTELKEYLGVVEDQTEQKQQSNPQRSDKTNNDEKKQDNAAILKNALENINFPPNKISEEIARILLKKQLIERNQSERIL